MSFYSAAYATGPFGQDPTEVEAPVQRTATAAALHYDGTLRDWLLDANGVPVPADPTDVGMALSFCDPLNNDLFSIEYLGLPDTQKRLEDIVANAQPAKRLVAEGKAKIMSVDYEEQERGLKVLVRYQNLVTGSIHTV